MRPSIPPLDAPEAELPAAAAAPEVPLALEEDGEFGLLIGDGEDALKIE